MTDAPQTTHVAWCSACLLLVACGCGGGWYGSSYDRSFPLGQVTDAHWETQQTNAEAADFIFFDHEFVGDTVGLAPSTKRHIESVALRLEHVPFPVVVERSPHNARPELDRARRRAIVEHLVRMGVPDADGRVVIAAAFAEGLTAIEAEQNYYSIFGANSGFSGGAGRRFGGFGGIYR